LQTFYFELRIKHPKKPFVNKENSEKGSPHVCISDDFVSLVFLNENILILLVDHVENVIVLKEKVE